MEISYAQLQARLQIEPRCWLVSGGAGFIGSHLVEKLLSLGQRVRVLDNHFSSTPENLRQVAAQVGPQLAANLELMIGDIRHQETCVAATVGVDQVIHLAALGSVPLSMVEPMLCHEINTTGTLNLMLAAQAAGLKRFVYASSSAVYGDDVLPMKREDSLGQALSPYAASKYINEIYAKTMHLAYGFEPVGLRFFNVFGPRQDPQGAYAAVIPCWIYAMTKGDSVYINGDGRHTRDFCFVKDVVQALLLASYTKNPEAFGKAFNVGLGRATDLNELFETLRKLVLERAGEPVAEVIRREFRPGDIRHSCADTSRVEGILGFKPEHTVAAGLQETVAAFAL
jgi:UDP-N-acetylglucosamine/UDP-N-acetylgalactosamine 4-epimerase